MADYYIAGTISLTNGSAAIVGTGTAWQIANVAGGTIFVQGEGNALPLASIEDDTHATAALEWTGATGSYSYALLRATAFSEQLEANSNIMSRLLVGLEAGTLYRYDATGDTADRATYDDRPKGFAFLAIDGAQPELYIKASATSGDWAGPFAYGTGPQGPAPAVTFEPVVTGAPGSDASMAVIGSGEAGDPYELTFTIPAGDLGINWRGTYSGATAYAARDGVLDNGSAWIALQATTGNAPPVLPTTANSYWSLVAQKGTDGTGVGDVVGPASAVDGSIPAFSGTTGKALKTQTNTQAKAWLASTALDVSFDNSTANLFGSPSTVQAAINAVASSYGKNDALLALEIADLKGSRMGMKGGIADAFDDETGVNTGGSTNQTYDATNDWYAPTTASTMIPQATGTAIGDTTANGGLAAAFDGITSTPFLSCARTVSNTATNGYVGKNYSASPKIIGSATIYGSSDNGLDGTLQAATITMVLRGKNGSAPSSRTDGTSLGTTSFSDAAGVSRTITSSDLTTAWDYVWFDVSTTASAGVYVAEAQFYGIPTPNNMTLVSAAYTASSAPSTARAAVQLVEVDSITINTDVTAEVSRDGGTTWTAVTLSLSTNLNGVKVYEGTTSISGQPSGTSMRWRVKTLNNKNVDVSGVVLQWL